MKTLSKLLTLFLTPLEWYGRTRLTHYITNADFSQGRVVMPGSREAIRWTLFDHILYPLAGIQELTFYLNPQGAGITTSLGATVGSTKTRQDTNLDAPGLLPRFQEFLIQNIQVGFYPGSSAAANTFLARDPVVSAAAIAAGDLSALNDHNTFRVGGSLELNIGSKPYLEEAPLMRFPMGQHFGLSAAAATTAATDAITAGAADAFGLIYYVKPNITLLPMQNFKVFLRWPGLVALPSGFNARIGLYMEGAFARNTQ